MSTPPRTSSRRQRGATLTGYALTVAVMVVVALGSMAALEDNSESFLTDSGTSIGEPRVPEMALESAPSGMPSGNSRGSGTTTTTTTTPPSTTTPSTTPSSSTPPSTTAPLMMAAANYDYPAGNPSYAGDPSGAQASGLSQTLSFVAATAGTYRVEFEILASGDDAADSIHVDIGSGLYRWNTVQNVTGSTWQTTGLAGGADPTSLEISLADNQNFDVTMYPREPGVSIGNVRIVRIGD